MNCFSPSLKIGSLADSALAEATGTWREIEPVKDNRLAIREKILTFENRLSQIPGAFLGDNDCCPLKHTYADGVYVREIFIPKGLMIVGKIHRHSHPNFLMQGEVSVLTEEGAQRIKAPLSMISPAGTKRVVYTHADTVWITVHVTEKTDLTEIEEQIIAPSYEALDGLGDAAITGFIKEIKEIESCRG
jgi:hypothetical protein